MQVLDAGSLLPISNERLALPAVQQKKRPKCIKCGGRLVIRRFVETWYTDGRPDSISSSMYCARCKIRWLEEKVNDIKAYNTFRAMHEAAELGVNKPGG